ncbi:hypothetical protein AXG93_2767s1010 [Marchantia polymorpha subsp. ruderalis]|uniref:Uncharacterized protein n=1 Tax=Marchantia polymorpha subsp. ruderalis TaxID=1480154 RepID=A0A176VW17_MARPO|nr:hypothetical protein AXG93_2767s1010 [Marchantia polymorpha subsp. ruderalis]
MSTSTQEEMPRRGGYDTRYKLEATINRRALSPLSMATPDEVQGDAVTSPTLLILIFVMHCRSLARRSREGGGLVGAGKRDSLFRKPSQTTWSLSNERDQADNQVLHSSQDYWTTQVSIARNHGPGEPHEKSRQFKS